KSINCGQSWEIISPDLTTNDTLKQKQYESGGLTIDDTNAENHTTIIAVAPSSVDENVIWVGTDDGNLQVTRDGGETWTNTASRLTGARANSWIPQIVASEKNAGEAFVIVNDYRRNDFRPMAYHTTDYGATYRRIVDENKVEGHALSIAQDPEVSNLLWLGTEYGLYFTIDNGMNWNKYTHGYPQAPTRDLKIHPREKDLVIGTYGRAAYILDDTRPFQEIAKTGGKILEQNFAAFPSPDAYLNYNLSVKGSRFVADGTFVGDNRRNGAMLTVWVKPEAEEKETMPAETTKKKKKKKKERTETEEPEEEEKKAAKKSKMKLAIINMEGDTVRMYKTKVDTGMQRVYWNLRKDGVRSPSRREVKKDANVPSGRKVRPGKYKVVMTYGESKDSTEVNVLADPRVTQSKENLDAEIKTRDDFEANIKRATGGFNRIIDAKKTVKLVNAMLVNLPDSTQTQIKDLGKVVSDSLKTLEHLFLSPEKQKGIRRNDTTLMSSVWRTYGYLSSSVGAPNPTTMIVIEQAEVKIDAALEKIDAFFEKDWKAYRDAVEAVEKPLFKE
ncbi:MAG: hypothetical protein ACI85O_003436, partial [Saprospiraceae bacterium]